MVVSVKSPAELTEPVVVSARLSVSVSSPLVALAKDPRLEIVFALVSEAPPTELPINVEALTIPPLWSIVPADVSVTEAVPASMVRLMV